MRMGRVLHSVVVATSLAIAALAAASGFIACGDDEGSSAPPVVGSDASGAEGGGPIDGAAALDGQPLADAPTVVPAGARRLAIEVNPQDGAQYVAKVELAKAAAGVSIIPSTLPWGYLLETSAPDAGASKIDGFWFRALSDVLTPRQLGLLLSVPLVDTVAVQAPPDLRPMLENGTLSLDAPEVIDRYKKVIDSYFANTDASLDLAYLLVSNEADVWLTNRPPAAWTALSNFLVAVRAYVHVVRPSVRVGINVTFGGIADPVRRPKIATLIASADVTFVSYYFGANGFGAPVGTSIANDIATMVQFSSSATTAGAAKPLVLKEHGYPTGVTGHSPSGQVDFITQTMKAWDDHASAIPLVVFSRMFDGKRENCEKEATDYGAPGNEEFIQFLCTLGLRTVDDTPKLAWDQFVTSATARGFK